MDSMRDELDPEEYAFKVEDEQTVGCFITSEAGMDHSFFENYFDRGNRRH